MEEDEVYSDEEYEEKLSMDDSIVYLGTVAGHETINYKGGESGSKQRARTGSAKSSPIIKDLLKEYLELGQLSHRSALPVKAIEPLMGPKTAPPEFYQALKAVRESGRYPNLEEQEMAFINKLTKPVPTVPPSREQKERAKNRTRGTNFLNSRDTRSVRIQRSTLGQPSSVNLRRQREEYRTTVDSLNNTLRKETLIANQLSKANKGMEKILIMLRKEEKCHTRDLSQISGKKALLEAFGNEKIKQLHLTEQAGSKEEQEDTSNTSSTWAILKKYFHEDDIKLLTHFANTLPTIQKEEQLQVDLEVEPEAQYDVQDTMRNLETKKELEKNQETKEQEPSDQETRKQETRAQVKRDKETRDQETNAQEIIDQETNDQKINDQETNDQETTAEEPNETKEHGLKKEVEEQEKTEAKELLREKGEQKVLTSRVNSSAHDLNTNFHEEIPQERDMLEHHSNQCCSVL